MTTPDPTGAAMAALLAGQGQQTDALPATGSAMAALLAGHGASAPVPGENPQAAAPKKGRGGLLGFLGRTVHEVAGAVNPVHIAEGVGRLGEDLGKAPFDLGEKVINTAAGTHIGNAFARDTSWSKASAQNELNHALPAIGGAMHGAGQTVAHAVGNVQLLADLATKPLTENVLTGKKTALAPALSHPLGNGFEKTLVGDYSQHPVDSLLNDAANLSLLFGGAGKALTPEAAAADEGEQAAAQSARAHAAATLHGASEGLGRVAAAPLLPFAKLGGAAAEAVGNIFDRGEAATAVRDSTLQGAVKPTDMNLANHEALKGVTDNPQEFAAAMLRAQGHTPLLEALSSDPASSAALDHTLATLDNGQGLITPATARLAVNPTPDVLAAEEAIRSIGGGRAERELAGFGRKPGQSPMNPDQMVPEPRLGKVDEMMAPAVAKAEPTTDAGRTGTAKGLRAFATRARDLANSAQDKANQDDLDMRGTDEAKRSATQFRTLNKIAKMAETRADAADAAAAPRPGNVDLAAEGAKARDSVEAAPAKYRTPMTVARQAAADLAEQAKGATGPAADDLQRIAAEAERMGHLDFWQQQETQPSHVIGSAPAKTDENGLPTTRTNRGRLTNQKATQERETTNVDYSKQGFSREEFNNLKSAAHNEGVKVLLGKVGSSPRALLGDEAESMTGQELAAAAHEQGLVGYNPNASTVQTIGVDPDHMTADTHLIPAPVLDELTKNLAKDKPSNLAQGFGRGVGKTVDFATRHAYRDVLGLTPHYAAIRTIGNALIAHVKGDVPLGDFPRLIKQGIEERKSLPAALTEHLNDETAAQPGKFSRVTQAAPRFVDKMSRTIVYLHKMEEGASPEQAVVEANKAMGDLASMSKGEQAIVTRTLPVYPWLKTVAGAAGKLGWDHPSSVVFATHLASIAAQDPQAFKQNAIESMANPLSIFGGGGGLVNPVVRAGIGAATGINVTKLASGSNPVLKRAPTDHQFGPLSFKDLPYYIASQFPAGKLALQSPLSGLDQKIARYPTGQPELVKHNVVPSYLPAVKTPLGDFGSYWRTAVGLPEDPKQNLQGKVSAAKAKQSSAKTAADYSAIIKYLKARGIK